MHPAQLYQVRVARVNLHDEGTRTLQPRR
jgi:hypothetical protein